MPAYLTEADIIAGAAPDLVFRAILMISWQIFSSMYQAIIFEVRKIVMFNVSYCPHQNLDWNGHYISYISYRLFMKKIVYHLDYITRSCTKVGWVTLVVDHLVNDKVKTQKRRKKNKGLRGQKFDKKQNKWLNMIWWSLNMMIYII